MSDLARIDSSMVGRFNDLIKDVIDDYQLTPPTDKSNSKIDDWLTREQGLITFQVADKAKRYFTKLSDTTKKILIEQQYITDDLAAGEKDLVAFGYGFDLELEVRAVVNVLDKTKLLVELRKLGVDQEIIDKAINNSMKTSTPKKYYKFVDKV